MKLYNDQRNAQVFHLFTSALHVSGFLVAHFQRQVYNFGISIYNIEYEYTDIKGGIKIKELHYLSKFLFKKSRANNAYFSNSLIPVA
jgi:hypothetical protein